MAYNKQNFVDGQVLTAEQLNKIEEGIAALESMIPDFGLCVRAFNTRISASNFATKLPSMDAATPNTIYSVLKTKAMTIENWPEGVGYATFVTLVPEVNSEKNSFRVQLLFELGTEKFFLRTNSGDTWKSWITLGAGTAATGLTLYVSTNGDDTADGSSAYPLATFNKAIQKGATTIIAEPGTYAQTISASGVNNLLIRANKKEYDKKELNPKIILDNSETLTLSDAASDGKPGVWRCLYTATNTSRIYKVFISKTLSIIHKPEWESIGYNANLWELCGDIAKDVRLVPAESLDKCIATERTFFYDGSYIYVHPTGGVISDKRYVVPSDDDTIVNFENCNNLTLEDVQTEYGFTYGINIQNCRNATLTDCDAHHNTNGEGFRLDYTNARLTRCKAHNNRNDGFNFHENGYTELVDCCAMYNSDDGVSHHQGCSGTIIGGEYSHNGSGGITPAFGAEVNVYGAIMRGNRYGLQVIGANDYPRRTMIAMHNVITENTDGGLYVKKNTVIGMNTIHGNDGNQIVLDTNGVYTGLNGNIVLTDQTTGQKYTVYVDDGKLNMEVV